MLDISLDELRGKSLDDALIYIAERNAGVLPSSAARGLLVEAGVLTGSQVGNALWNVLDPVGALRARVQGAVPTRG